jgi:ribulose-phosphate 3-epimerase
MSVNPGFSGQKFIPSVYEKIRHVRSMTSSNNGFEIEVDGGVNNENAPELARCGADILVAGAYILGADDYSQRIRSLRDVE